jgi:hypothetical protein
MEVSREDLLTSCAVVSVIERYDHTITVCILIRAHHACTGHCTSIAAPAMVLRCLRELHNDKLASPCQHI